MRTQWHTTRNLVVGFVALLLAAGAGGFVVSLVSSSPGSFRKLPEFPVASFCAGDPLWGNSSYRLSGVLDNMILESQDRKKYLVSIIPEGASVPLPVIIPVKASQVPLQRQQKLLIEVGVDSSGRIIASQCLVE